MTDADRMLAWLRDAMDAAQRDAEAAGGDGWRKQEHPSDTVAIYDSKGEPVVYDEGSPSEEQQAHIVRNSPAAVLRRIAADRSLLDDLLAERHAVNEGDCWYTCAAATEEVDGGETCDDDRRGKPCDCGRDIRVARRVRLLAESWGWTEGES
jgi:hypothetical protein